MTIADLVLRLIHSQLDEEAALPSLIEPITFSP
jgi:hypothetical protein